MSKMNPNLRKENAMTFNYSFMGNPGTGKTTVAELFARILCDSGIRSNPTWFKTSAQQLKDEGSDKFRQTLQAADNGVLFIDEVMLTKLNT
jgi:replication-associated recombination protein RarA